MRRIKEDELRPLTSFMVEQYFEKEELQKMFSSINKEKAKTLAKEMVYFEMEYLFKYGDIFIYDDNITGAIIGIEYKKMSLLKSLPAALKTNKILNKFSKDEIKIIKENKKIINEVHNPKWFKKYCKNPYYCIQFAIDKDKRGKGIAREMLEFLFSYVKEQNNDIVLETLTSSYVPIYEHFGFEVKEIYETKNKDLKEFRMLKKFCTKRAS